MKKYKKKVSSYKSLQVSLIGGIHKLESVEKSVRSLAKDEILIKVKYSSLNYKDALSVTGKAKIIREDILTPGLDLCGEVYETNSKKFNVGDKVLATGFGLGETLNGSFSEYVYLPSSMTVKLPKELSLIDSMKLGTAGFTVALAVEKLKQNNQNKISGPFAITGSTGGVGSFAINILSQLGYEIHAITRKHSSEEYLRKIGATKVIILNKIKLEKNILSKIEFSGAIDNTGGKILPWLIKKVNYGGNIVSIGMSAGSEIATSNLPFLIRGINLLGVTSTNYPIQKRLSIWKKLSTIYYPKKINTIHTKTITMNEILKYSNKMINGNLMGRIIIKIR